MLSSPTSLSALYWIAAICASTFTVSSSSTNLHLVLTVEAFELGKKRGLLRGTQSRAALMINLKSS
jgi:hypothetical protein